MKYTVTFDSDQYPNEILLHSELMSAFGGPRHPIHVEPAPETLLDQGISRLQLLAFLRGDHSDAWNGSKDYPWVRYRAHQIDRNPTPDGNLFRLTHQDVGHCDRTAGFTCRPDSDEDALVTVRMIDRIIDAVIAQHGADGVA